MTYAIDVKGKLVLVDDAIYHQIKELSLSLCQAGYVRFRINGRRVHLHRFVLEQAGIDLTGLVCDHANRNRTDNRLVNLRSATLSQNAMNRKLPSTSTTGLKGVHFETKSQKFTARIKKNGKQTFLGYFTTAEDASNAYANAAKIMFEDFARIK